MNHNKTEFSQPCALCGALRKLERSHIVPQFVYRWAKAASGESDLPDGPSRRLLCGHCEDRFSAYESEFARQVFHPFATNAVLAAKYSAWLRKFAASVCWRIITTNPSDETIRHADRRWAPEMSACRKTWKDYLAGRRPDVGAHHLHLLTGNATLDGATAGVKDLGAGRHPAEGTEPPATLRWSPRTIGMETVSSDSTAFVYAKLGPIIVIGLIADPAPEQWQGTRINAEGKLKFRAMSVPEPVRGLLYDGNNRALPGKPARNGPALLT